MNSVLIVDDDVDACQVLEKAFSSAGIRTVIKHDGRAALQHVLNEMPDAVVLDILLPEMDGWGFLQVVRSYLRISTLPVVVVTGLPTTSLAEQATNLGVKGMFRKGEYKLKDLIDTIKALIISRK